jgi:hypothetical protein
MLCLARAKLQLELLLISENMLLARAKLEA